mgnify:CR=1 FL=1
MATYSVGITGGIGSGKSLFSKVCVERGYLVMDADTLAKELMSTSQIIKDALIREFGKESYENGVLNKAYISQKIFKAPSLLQIINSIVHPVVIEAIREGLVNSPKKLAFAESALIYESNFAHIFDKIVVIAADDETRIARVIKRGAITQEQVLRIISNQIPQSEKIAQANHVLYNNSSVEEFRESANKFLDSLEQLP